MEQKDRIEELILENLEGLNDNEPMEGHFERFEAKLKLQDKKKKINLSIVWKVAAVIVFAVLLTNQAYIYISGGKQNLLSSKMSQQTDFTLASVSPEYEEVEFYYTNAINVGLSQWNALKSEGLISDEEQDMMNNELKEFEDLQKGLQTDLKANPHDERVINAMLEYYQAKLGVINMIVTKLQEVKELQEENKPNLDI